MVSRPPIKYVTFDCYGTLTHFQIAEVVQPILADRIERSEMETFLADFSVFRRDEVLGGWQPYFEVLDNALARSLALWDRPHRISDSEALYEAVPTWGPHPDVIAPLCTVAEKLPLVILSNAMDSQISRNVEQLKAPFHAVYTAERAGAYKPRLAAFEYMLDQLDCDAAALAHVSSSIRYDLIPAHDLRIPTRIYVNRGYEPSAPFYSTHEIDSLAGLPEALGL